MYDPADSKPAPGNVPGASARVITLGAARERIFNMFCVFNATDFDANVLKALREPESYQLQSMGRTEVTRVMNKFKNRHRLFKELVLAKVLTKGVVYMDNAGTILESSSGATTTCEFEVAAGHKDSLGGLITGMFSTAGTDIAAIIESIDDAAASANVPPPTDIWINKLNLESLRNNDYFADWATHNEAASTQVLRGGMIENLWGKTWHFVGTKYQSSDGTMKPYIPLTGSGSAVFTPPPGGDWVKASNGLTCVPKSIEIKKSVDEVIGQIDTVYGEFMYAKLIDDPVKMIAYMGDKFGFNFNEPDAIWQADAFA